MVRTLKSHADFAPGPKVALVTTSGIYSGYCSEGLPRGSMFPSKTALCSPVPTVLAYFSPVQHISLPPSTTINISIGEMFFNLIGMNGFHVKAKNKRFTAAGSRCRQNLKKLHQKAWRTCSTIIFPRSTDHIIDLWRCRCCSLLSSATISMASFGLIGANNDTTEIHSYGLGNPVFTQRIYRCFVIFLFAWEIFWVLFWAFLNRNLLWVK